MKRQQSYNNHNGNYGTAFGSTANQCSMLTDLPFKSARCYLDDETSHTKQSDNREK